MEERQEIPVLRGQVRRGDDVSIPCTNFSITLTGYTFDGTIKSVVGDSAITSPNLAFTIVGTNGVTIDYTAAQTTLMTLDQYYSWCRWTDTGTKKKTWLKIICDMVG